MTAVGDYRKALAEALTGIVGVGVTPHPPPQPRASTGYLRPPSASKWIDYKAPGATFTAPVVALALVLIAPPLPAWAVTFDWFEECALEIAKARATTLGNGWKLPPVLAWSAPGLLDAGSGLIAAEVEFVGQQIKEA